LSCLGIAGDRITDLRHFMNAEFIDARLRRRQPEAATYLAGLLGQAEHKE
jgi:hypothetical protein